MAAADTSAARKLGATTLLGKGLTPGKLRGLQRISNPNGTLTMVAFDQNSSMIEMAQKALKGKGHDREPTFEEVVEAKVDMIRQMAPAASGILIDAYYGYWPAMVSGPCRPTRACWSGSRSRAARRTRSAARWARSSPGSPSRRSS